MAKELEITIRQITITPGSRVVEIYYHIALDNPVFSGAIGGGKTILSDPEACQKAFNLAETLESQILLELGLQMGPTTDSLEDLTDNEEDAL